ncbi:MAG: helix-turn-helix domain-containing protein [Planctomycetaceae bacterium]|nr:MAG: helix-turn-helix domain-containing protein [Planctomycetaceae bacterium]
MPHSKKKPTNIGLVFLHTLAYYRRALRGVWRYALARPQWELTSIVPEIGTLRFHQRLRPDGLIVTANTPAVEESLRSWRRPAVNVSAVIPGQRFPRVGVDNRRVGRLAAEHFIEIGVRHFAFVGPAQQVFSSERQEAFCDAVREAGADVECYISKSSQGFDPLGLHWDLEPDVQRWLRKLAKPVGIFTPNDIWGVQVLMACRRARLRVPDEVAVMGVDNDSLYCEMTRPGLSSVIVPAEQIGFEAVALLERLLGGEKPPREPLLLPPVGIRSRASSEILAIDDEQVAAAIRFIRQRAHLPLQVEDVLKHVPVGRRTLERRFRTRLGWGLAAEIQRTHLALARRLLAETELSMQAVAIQAGFQDYRHMARVFRQQSDMTATQFRATVRSPTRNPQ